MSVVSPPVSLAPGRERHAALPRLAATWRAHRVDARLGLALASLAGVVHAWGMARSPGALDDEGTYVAQAWAVQHWGELAHYTYWYDHPPLGWLQIAAWSALTGAFSGAANAVIGARTFMLVAQVASCGLLYVLGRRLGIGRAGVAVAVGAFALSPLAVMFHRYVLLDNIATPWLLGAFVLAASPRRHLGASAGAAACLVVAVLSKETTLVLAPALAWQLWDNSDRRSRHFSLALAGAVFVTLLGAYPLLAVLKGELLPGDGHVSLLGSIVWQLAGRTSSGSILDPTSDARGLLGLWLGVDAWLLAAGVALVPAAMLARRLRPVALGLAIQAVMPLRPGYLPYPYVIALLPFAALVTGGVLDAAWRARPGAGEPDGIPARRPLLEVVASTRPRQLVAASRTAVAAARRDPPPRWLTVRRVAVVAGVGVFAAIGVPAWARGLHDQMTADRTVALRQASAWVGDHATPDDVVVVDDSLWVDLVEQGHAPQRVIWFYKVDLDPAVVLPRGWRSIDYVVLGGNGTSTEGLPTVQAAMEHSQVVASFGSGPDALTIHRVSPQS